MSILATVSNDKLQLDELGNFAKRSLSELTAYGINISPQNILSNTDIARFVNDYIQHTSKGNLNVLDFNQKDKEIRDFNLSVAIDLFIYTELNKQAIQMHLESKRLKEIRILLAEWRRKLYIERNSRENEAFAAYNQKMLMIQEQLVENLNSYPKQAQRIMENFSRQIEHLEQQIEDIKELRRKNKEESAKKIGDKVVGEYGFKLKSDTPEAKEKLDKAIEHCIETKSKLQVTEQKLKDKQDLISQNVKRDEELKIKKNIASERAEVIESDLEKIKLIEEAQKDKAKMEADEKKMTEKIAKKKQKLEALKKFVSDKQEKENAPKNSSSFSGDLLSKIKDGMDRDILESAHQLNEDASKTVSHIEKMNLTIIDLEKKIQKKEAKLEQYEEKLNEIKTNMKQKEQAIDNLMDLYFENKIDKEAFEARKKELEKEKREVNAQYTIIWREMKEVEKSTSHLEMDVKQLSVERDALAKKVQQAFDEAESNLDIDENAKGLLKQKISAEVNAAATIDADLEFKQEGLEQNLAQLRTAAQSHYEESSECIKQLLIDAKLNGKVDSYVTRSASASATAINELYSKMHPQSISSNEEKQGARMPNRSL